MKASELIDLLQGICKEQCLSLDDFEVNVSVNDSLRRLDREHLTWTSKTLSNGGEIWGASINVDLYMFC